VSDSSDNVGMDSMKPVESPEGAYENTPSMTVCDPNMPVVPLGRDAQTDDRRMSEVDGSGGNIMDDRNLDDRGYLLDLNVTSLGTEKRRGGWDPLATPYGGPVARANTSGTRGADDVMPGGIPVDNSMPAGEADQVPTMRPGQLP
jgi:hypothetical protein